MSSPTMGVSDVMDPMEHRTKVKVDRFPCVTVSSFLLSTQSRQVRGGRRSLDIESVINVGYDREDDSPGTRYHGRNFDLIVKIFR